MRLEANNVVMESCVDVVVAVGSVVIIVVGGVDVVVSLVVEGGGAEEAGAAGGQLEGFYGEGEVLVVGVVDEEAVVDGLLQTLGLVAVWHQRAGLAGGEALLQAGGLRQGLVVHFDAVDDDAPLALRVDGAQRPHVGGLRWAEVGLVVVVAGQVHGQLCVEVSHVRVQGEQLFCVTLGGRLDLVGRVVLVLEAPRLAAGEGTGGVAVGGLGCVVGGLGCVVGGLGRVSGLGSVGGVSGLVAVGAAMSVEGFGDGAVHGGAR